MHRFIDAANAITIASLAAAYFSVVLAIRGHTGWAMSLLMLCGICDLLDGLVARRLGRNEEQSSFGGKLDSLVDGCAFGLAPAIMLYAAGMNSILEMVLLALLPMCVVWRVAYFEVVGMQPSAADNEKEKNERSSQNRYFIGLPATYAALAIPLAATLGFAGRPYFHWGVSAVVALLCLAMVSRVRIPKPGVSLYGVLVLMAIALTCAFAYYGTLLPSANGG